MCPLQESWPHLVAAGSQAGMSLPRMSVSEMFPDRRTAASDGCTGKPYTEIAKFDFATFYLSTNSKNKFFVCTNFIYIK